MNPTLDDMIEAVQKWRPVAAKIVGELYADDVIQIASICVWKNHERYNPKYALNTWVGTIVRNKALTALRDSRRKKRGTLFADCAVFNSESGEWEFSEDKNIFLDERAPGENVLCMLADLTPETKLYLGYTVEELC